MSEGEVVGRRRGGVVALLGSFAFVGSATVGLGSSAGAAPSSPPPFTTPGTFSLLVPVGVDSITVVACAARGGNGEGGSDRVTVNGGDGALGGQSRATVPVTSGETLSVVVGARGGDGTGFSSGGTGGTAGSGAPNAAGTGGNGFDVPNVPNSPFGEIVGGPGGGGGGGSALLRGATELVSAGGGGGGSGGAIRVTGIGPVDGVTGGSGGGATGSIGGAGHGGHGGTQAAGGTPGTGASQGSPQGNGDGPNGGGGGGGGHTGGGGGGDGTVAQPGGGGGGSGLDANAATFSNCANPTGNGDVNITYNGTTATTTPQPIVAVPRFTG